MAYTKLKIIPLNNVLSLVDLTDKIKTADIRDAAITTAKLAVALQSAFCPTGSILAYAGTTAPTGFLLCNGTAVGRIAYATLFALVATTWGIGDGSTTFNLPNLSGIFLKGAGTQTISGVIYSGTFGTMEQDQTQGHKHSALNAQPGVSSTINPIISRPFNAATYTTEQIYGMSTGDDGVNGSPRVGTTTRPANASVNYIIKY
jgi:microcystin-dependent protein